MKAKTKVSRLFVILLALVMVVGLLPTTALAEEPDAFLQFADAPGEFFYNISGGYNSEGPTVDTIFTLTEPTMITGIWTYHWNAANYDIDFSRQTIQLKDTNTNTVVYSGAVRVGHYANTRDCDWIVLPNIVLPAGTYQVIDSHNESWCALNSKGVCMVKGYSTTPSATADFSTDPTAALALLNAAKTGTTDSTWDSDTKTLTLNGVNFTTTAATAVKLPDDAKIVLNGENTITGGNSASEGCYGIYAEGSLTISGSGTLNVTGGATTGHYSSYGIYASRDLTIESGTVIATGGTVSQDYNSNGIFVNSGYVTIESGTVIATGGTAGLDSCGINSDYVNIKGGKVEATGGTAGEDSYGIYLYQNITIEGGTVIAKANTKVMNKAPSALPTAYQWRTSESGAYNQYSDSAYTFDSAHTYLEIKELEYTVTVTNGTASVSKAAAGTTVTLTANAASTGEVFDKWVAESGNVTLADASSATTTFTMPAGDVSVKATYHTHSYGSEWKSNADKHWHECACNAKSEEAAHAADDWITDTPATATTDGTKHKECTVCHRVLETGTIPATGHSVSFNANGGSGTMADVTGVLGEYTLPENGFTAPNGKQFKCWSVNGTEKAVGATINVTANTTVTSVWETIPATSTEYDILDGANSSWTQNSDGSLSIRGSGAFSEFVGVKVDRTLVDAKYYTVKEGSTIVTLKADYLNTCTVGSHTLEIVWTDGSASTTFSVNAKSPQTGDNSMMWIWIALLFVSGIGVMGTTIYIRKKKYSVK